MPGRFGDAMVFFWYTWKRWSSSGRKEIGVRREGKGLLVGGYFALLEFGTGTRFLLLEIDKLLTIKS
jgi:hypothetical protein